MFLNLNIRGDGELDINEPFINVGLDRGFSRHIYSLLTTLNGDVKSNRSFGASICENFGRIASIELRDKIKREITDAMMSLKKYLVDNPKVFVRIVGKGQDAHFLIYIDVGYMGKYTFRIKYGSRGIYYVEGEDIETETVIDDEAADLLHMKSDNVFLSNR